MKTMQWIAMLLLAISQPAFAGEPGQFVCTNWGVNTLALDFGRGKFVESFLLQHGDKDMIQDLLIPEEIGLDLFDTSLDFIFSIGTCVATPGEEVIVRCNGDRHWAGGGFGLSYIKEVSPRFQEHITLHRNLAVDSLSIVVRTHKYYDPDGLRIVTDAILELKASGESARGPFELAVTRKMGELVPEEKQAYNTCALLTDSFPAN